MTITFKTSHKLNPSAAFTIRLPAGITEPAVGSVLAVTSPDGSTNATTAVVLAPKLIQI